MLVTFFNVTTFLVKNKAKITILIPAFLCRLLYQATGCENQLGAANFIFCD